MATSAKSTIVIANLSNSGFFSPALGKQAQVYRSSDGGLTWEAPMGIGQLPANGRAEVPGIGSLIYIPRRNCFMAVFNWSPRNVTNRKKLQELWISEDNGSIWSEIPFEMPGLDPRFVADLVPNGDALVLRNAPYTGRILLPAQRRHALRIDEMEDGSAEVREIAAEELPVVERSLKSYPYPRYHLLYSDDDGKTWQLGAGLLLGHSDGSPLLYERPDGAIVANGRNGHKPGADNILPPNKQLQKEWKRFGTSRTQAISTDGGVTWGETQAAGPHYAGYSQGALLRIPEEHSEGRGEVLVLAMPTSDGARRADETAWLSYDGGVTWPVYRHLEIQGVDGQFAGGVAKSGAVLADGSIVTAQFFGKSGEYASDLGLRVLRYRIPTVEHTQKQGHGRVPVTQMELCDYGGTGKRSRALDAGRKDEYLSCDAPTRFRPSGSVRYRFSGEPGRYTLTVRYKDNPGAASYRLMVDGREIDRWTADKDDEGWHERTSPSAELKTGSLILLIGMPAERDRTTVA